MKITETTTKKSNGKTKAEMAELLEKFAKSTFGKKQDCITEVNKAIQNLSKTPKAELERLVNLTTDLVAAEKKRRDEARKQPIEKALKPIKGSGKKKADKPAEPAEKADTPPKKAGKIDKPKKADKADKPVDKPKKADKKATEKADVESFNFPKVIKDKDFGNLRIASEIQTFADLREYVEANPDSAVIFAVKWTVSDINTYNYEEAYAVKFPAKMKKSFPKDLDLLQYVLIMQTIDRVLTVSKYTEALQHFDSHYIPYGEDGYRKAEDTPFEIYVVQD